MYFMLLVSSGASREGGMGRGRVKRKRKLRGVGPSVGPCLMTQPPHTVISFSQEFRAGQEML